MENRREDLLKKLKRLSDTGVGGEKENAKKLLDSLLKKYDLSECIFEEEAVYTWEFRYRGKIEKVLLMHVMYKVMGNTDCIKAWAKSKKQVLICRCTETKRLEIEFTFEFYKNLLEKDMDTLLHAFIIKHDIFGNHESKSESSISQEELDRIFGMKRWLSDGKLYKQLEG